VTASTIQARRVRWRPRAPSCFVRCRTRPLALALQRPGVRLGTLARRFSTRGRCLRAPARIKAWQGRVERNAVRQHTSRRIRRPHRCVSAAQARFPSKAALASAVVASRHLLSQG
jgi:hypothetical protein